jgi:hypothetical protein
MNRKSKNKLHTWKKYTIYLACNKIHGTQIFGFQFIGFIYMSSHYISSQGLCYREVRKIQFSLQVFHYAYKLNCNLSYLLYIFLSCINVVKTWNFSQLGLYLTLLGFITFVTIPEECGISDYGSNVVIINAGFCEQCNIVFGTIKCEEFLYQLSNCRFLKKYSATWS